MAEENANKHESGRGEDGRFLPGNKLSPGGTVGVPRVRSAKHIMQTVMEEVEENGLDAGTNYCRRIRELAGRGKVGDSGYATAVNKLWDDSPQRHEHEVNSQVRIVNEISGISEDLILGKNLKE